jgi:hypothetical protein
VNDLLLSAIAAQIQTDSNHHAATITWDTAKQLRVTENWEDINSGVMRGITAIFTNEGSTQNAAAKFTESVSNSGVSGVVDDGHETHYAQDDVTTALGNTPTTVSDITWHYSSGYVANHECLQYDNIFVYISQNIGIKDPSAPVTPT